MEQQKQQQGLCSFTPGMFACCEAGVSTGLLNMRLSITSTTGSPVELSVSRGETVEGLRAQISHKLRMQTDRIVLLHKDKQLTAGKLLDLGVTDGSKLTLVPVVEAGIASSTARAERGIMDVLESLTEVQISDFLSGRSLLTLNLGIGAHVMYVQLQLSAQNVAELQQHQDFRAKSRRELQTSLPGRISPSDSTSTCFSSNTAGFTTPPASKSSSQGPNSSGSQTLNSQRNRTSLNSTAPASYILPPNPANHRHCTSPHPSCPTPTHHESSPVISTPSLPSEYLHPSSPLQAATPVCSTAPSSSMPAPLSPPPASTFNECNIQATFPTEPSKQPGAVIESFVSHSPGVFSGTFSGTLAPNSPSGINHPRGGISIILQILNDLLRAALHHREVPPAISHLHSLTSNPPAGLRIYADEQGKVKSKTSEIKRTEHPGKTRDEKSRPLHAPSQENQALHCKLERLQLLMQQRRTHRRTRRKFRLTQASLPYHHPHHCS
ncbi:midnolin-like [Cheilinus undulatus]|uniref:midnolin-like n=1 Tax=Cheilinus undulatus TaxID=241271 RepID=UPI001BD4FBEE|nr:midnolin-like [Cheilinus undulatus]